MWKIIYQKKNRDKKIPFWPMIKLAIVDLLVITENLLLFILNLLLFPARIKKPKTILIYKIGNIGDIICAVPSFIAIRRAYPGARITLLTSPGRQGAKGAKDFLEGAWYLDELKVYYSEDIDSFTKKILFLKIIQIEKPDLFIHVPDDLSGLWLLLRSMIFAKAIKSRSAFGFVIRTIRLFKKTQVDYLYDKTEVESLIDLLRANKLPVSKVEFDLPVSQENREKVKALLREKWPLFLPQDILVVLVPGGSAKRITNRWPVERFRELTKYLIEKWNAKIVIIGSKGEKQLAFEIGKGINSQAVLNVTGQDILEDAALLRHSKLLIANSTGPLHIAALLGIPVLGFFSVRDVPGRWSPYGQSNSILYHKFLDCDYQNEECIKKSIEMISVEEAKQACDELIKS